MTCGLGEEELFILNVLYVGRNLNRSASLNSRLLLSKYRRRFNDDPRDAIKNLLNNNYITQIPKREIKYYISDHPKAFFALGQHGFSVVSGRRGS